MSHGTHMNESWRTDDKSKARNTKQRGNALIRGHTYESVMAHT